MSDRPAPDDKPKRKRVFPPQPKAFHITEPFQDRGLWCFWLTAENEVLEYVAHLPCILHPVFSSPFQRRLQGRVLFSINPRYDHEEAWVWISDLLESEASHVELTESWEDAIRSAHEEESKDEG